MSRHRLIEWHPESRFHGRRRTRATVLYRSLREGHSVEDGLYIAGVTLEQVHDFIKGYVSRGVETAPSGESVETYYGRRLQRFLDQLNRLRILAEVEAWTSPGLEQQYRAFERACDLGRLYPPTLWELQGWTVQRWQRTGYYTGEGFERCRGFRQYLWELREYRRSYGDDGEQNLGPDLLNAEGGPL